MPAVSLDRNSLTDIGLKLYEDSRYTKVIDTPQVFQPSGVAYTLTNFQPKKLAGVYELVNGVWQSQANYKVTGNIVKLGNAPTGLVLLLSKRSLSYIQLSSCTGKPKQLFIQGNRFFIYSDFQLGSVALSGGTSSLFEFSFESIGPWNTTLESSAVPDQIWFRAKAVSRGRHIDTAISLSALAYLGV